MNDNKFKLGNLYQLKVNNFHFDANGSVIPIYFNFITPLKQDQKYYYVNWKNSNIDTFILNEGEVLLCLDEEPRTLLYVNPNNTYHIGGKAIGFLYKKIIVIPWYSYVYEENLESILTTHMKEFIL